MRIFNGCPDAEASAWIKANETTKNRLNAAGFAATYFPMEQKWMAFKDYLPVSDFYPTIQQLADAVLSNNRSNRNEQ